MWIKHNVIPTYFLFVGLYYIFIKKPAIYSLKREDFPDVPKAGFDEWKTHENSSLNFLLWLL